jgi:DNA-binding NarL/FixJ family response regulator
MKIMLVDDHLLIRKGLTETLTAKGFQVVGHAATVTEALAVLNSKDPEICLVDINLGSENGIEVIKKGLVQKPNSKFLVLTMEDDLRTLNEAKSAGAIAYMTKSSPVENMVEVFQSILDGHLEFIRLGNFKDYKILRDFQLTQRELEVLALLPTGATAAAIGSLLFLAEATVKTHIGAIYRKLGAANRAQAVSISFAENLIAK